MSYRRNRTQQRRNPRQPQTSRELFEALYPGADSNSRYAYARRNSRRITPKPRSHKADH